jgi:hypothetical protein
MHTTNPTYSKTHSLASLATKSDPQVTISDLDFRLNKRNQVVQFWL